MDMIRTTQHKHGIMHKNKKQTWKTCILGIILPKPTKLIHQTQQNINKPYSNIIFSNLNKNTKSKKSRARNMKYFEKKRKPIPFLEDWWRIDEENGGFVSENGGFGRGRSGRDNETAHDARENWNFFENCLGFNLICAKHTFFATGISRKQVARSNCQKPVWQILKNLSECFSQLKGPLESKSRRESRNILSKLATGTSTHEPVAKVSRENAKNPKNWNVSKSFSWLGAWLARESQELLSKLTTGPRD